MFFFRGSARASYYIGSKLWVSPFIEGSGLWAHFSDSEFWIHGLVGLLWLGPVTPREPNTS